MVNAALESLIKQYVAKGIPRKMAKMLARAKLKKKEGGGFTGAAPGKERLKKLMKGK